MNVFSRIARALTARRPRITLQSIFIWMSVFTLLVSLWWTIRRQREAEERLEIMHSQFGVARILDRRMPASRALRSDNVAGVKTRIHVYQPANKRYRVCASLTGAGYFKQDFPPEEYAWETPEARDIWINVESSYQQGQGELFISIECESESRKHVIPLPATHFFNRLARGEVHGYFNVAHRPEPYGLGEWDNKDVPLLLYATGDHLETERTDGLVLWLDSAETSSPRSPAR